VQILETYLEFVLRPCQRVLVDHWPRPAPARMAPFFTGADTLIAFLAYCSQMTLKQCLLLHAPGLTPAAVLEELPRLIPKHLTG
jgi:hypothetical protein